MSELTLQAEDIERRRRRRAWRIAVIDIPRMRVVGCFAISLAIFLNNRFIVELPVAGPVTIALVASVINCTVTWLCLWFFWEKLEGRFDLSLFFLATDVPLIALAVYLTGAERSWLFPILLVRCVDQAQTTFRRSFGFAIAGTAAYGFMETWVVAIDHRPTDAGSFLAKMFMLAVFGSYIALTARTAERRQARMVEAVRASRELLARADEQSLQLLDARQRAEDGSASKSEFLANMSHEMRTPLHGVIGMLQLAIEDETSPRSARQLAMAKRSAESLLATIEDLLDFSKIEARKLDLEPIYFSVRDLLTETMKPLGVTAAAKNLDLAVMIAPYVPDSVWGDPVRLRQVLVNLVGNAIKFTERGEIVVRVGMVDKLMRFEVRDTGIGIAAEQRDRIFEPFAQVDGSHSRRFGGTGLGLAIVSRLVATMGGTLRLASEPGMGSSFTFEVPLPFDQVGTNGRTRSWERALADRCVLVVDRSVTAREAVAQVLRAHGMFVTAVATRDEIPPGSFDCVVTADALVAVEPAIIITSPLARVRDDRVRITRPVMERELIDAVGEALSISGAKDVHVDVRQRANEAGLHVLVAEDEVVSQEIAAEALRRLMHRVTVASDGQEALDILQREYFDVVFLDIQMPKLDGLEVARRFRATERGRRIPIVAMTAHSRREERSRCIEAGMDAVLVKPVDLTQFGETIRTLTGAEPIVNAVGGNMQLLARVSDAFAKQTPELMREIVTSIERKDGDALFRAAHKLKGAVGNFEGDPSYDLALMLESVSKEGDFVRASALAHRLESAVGALGKRITAAAAIAV